MIAAISSRDEAGVMGVFMQGVCLDVHGFEKARVINTEAIEALNRALHRSDQQKRLNIIGILMEAGISTVITGKDFLRDISDLASRQKAVQHRDNLRHAMQEIYSERDISLKLRALLYTHFKLSRCKEE